MKKIYFDYAATTPIDKEAIKAMAPYLGEKFGNPGSLHYFGQEALAAVDASRETIAEIIGADFNEIIFTGSATEANNLALRGIVKAARNFSLDSDSNLAPFNAFLAAPLKRRRFASAQKATSLGSSSIMRSKHLADFQFRIIVSSIEHESIFDTCRDLEKNGVEIVYLPVDKSGFLDLKKLKESLNERTILVSIMCANNEIGTIQPITEISKIIKAFKTERLMFSYTLYPVFHTDAVQSFQFLDCNVNNLGVDLMTLSAHKIYGPKGIGALYVANKVQHILNPIITGGGQEFNLRSGTENVASIVGFGKAVELSVKNRAKETERIGDLTDYFRREIKKIHPQLEINGENPKLPNILNVNFPGQNAQDLLIKLDINGIAVSSGSACSARALKPSYVLKAIGLADNKIKNSLRFSLGKPTTKKEIDFALKIIKKL